jgi:DNA-binding MarR family transcriptional regulator
MKNDKLLERWRDLESAHAKVRESLARALQREHQLSLSEYEVLERLASHSGEKCRMQDLSEESELSQSALSRVVQRLEDEGFVTRAVCDHDRRGVWAALTDTGRKVQDDAQPTYVAVLAETLDQRNAAAA